MHDHNFEKVLNKLGLTSEETARARGHSVRAGQDVRIDSSGDSALPVYVQLAHDTARLRELLNPSDAVHSVPSPPSPDPKLVKAAGRLRSRQQLEEVLPASDVHYVEHGLRSAVLGPREALARHAAVLDAVATPCRVSVAAAQELIVRAGEVITVGEVGKPTTVVFENAIIEVGGQVQVLGTTTIKITGTLSRSDTNLKAARPQAVMLAATDDLAPNVEQVGADGNNGQAGTPGTNGQTGSPGKNGVDGSCGKCSSQPTNGNQGTAGTDGAPGGAGSDGAAGPSTTINVGNISGQFVVEVAGGNGGSGGAGGNGGVGGNGGSAGSTSSNCKNQASQGQGSNGGNGGPGGKGGNGGDGGVVTIVYTTKDPNTTFKIINPKSLGGVGGAGGAGGKGGDGSPPGNSGNPGSTGATGTAGKAGVVNIIPAS